jgi:hypothetical protein
VTGVQTCALPISHLCRVIVLLSMYLVSVSCYCPAFYGSPICVVLLSCFLCISCLCRVIVLLSMYLLSVSCYCPPFFVSPICVLLLSSFLYISYLCPVIVLLSILLTCACAIIFSAFNVRQARFLPTDKASVYFFAVCVFFPNE